MLNDRTDAYELLKSLGAPNRLLNHAQLVGDVADLLLAEFQTLGVTLDFQIVQLGAALHDAGKIQQPQELSEPGTLHESAGELLLLANGVQPEVARYCVTHGAWQAAGVTLEELTVALADKLWKGKRESELELIVIDEVAVKLGVSRWDVFGKLDDAFEGIAAAGAGRVQGSATV